MSGFYLYELYTSLFRARNDLTVIMRAVGARKWILIMRMMMMMIVETYSLTYHDVRVPEKFMGRKCLERKFPTPNFVDNIEYRILAFARLFFSPVCVELSTIDPSVDSAFDGAVPEQR